MGRQRERQVINMTFFDKFLSPPQEVGATIKNVVSVTWYLVNIDDMPRVAKVEFVQCTFMIPSHCTFDTSFLQPKNAFPRHTF